MTSAAYRNDLIVQVASEQIFWWFLSIALVIGLVLKVIDLVSMPKKVQAKPSSTQADANPGGESTSGNETVTPAAAIVGVEEAPVSRKNGYRVNTLLGMAVFRNTLAVGKFGDWLTAQHYTRRPTGRYQKLKSKLPGGKGIDGVFWRFRSDEDGTIEVLVVENKINESKLTPGQLSVDWVFSRCRKMMASDDAELRWTASVILNALQPERKQTRHTLQLMLITHDLISGVTRRHLVDESGRKSRRHRSWNSATRIRRSLEHKIQKMEVWLDERG